MSWTIETIQQEWLLDGAIAIEGPEIVAAFDRCEQRLGLAWIEKSRGTLSGAIPTLSVVTMGQRLASLEGLSGTQQLVEKVRRNDRSASSELHALHLLRVGDKAIVELFPTVKVGSRVRSPDLRIKRGESPWVYVEVTQADTSKVKKRAMELLRELACTITGIRRRVALEIFLRREPSAEEVAEIIKRVPLICETVAPQREYLPGDLGLLFLADSPPGQIIMHDHPNEDVRPRIGVTRGIVGGEEPSRHVSVRLAFSDNRAEEFLSQESKQLPEGGPGIVMIDVGNASGAFTAWEPLLLRRFQPTIHTRVSGVCLFAANDVLADKGIATLTQVKLLINPHAAARLPDWIVEALHDVGAGYREFMDAAKEPQT
jgi:hypothetical protein